VPRAEFRRADPRSRLDECSYFSEFFLAQHTFVPEIFVGRKRGFPIAMTKGANGTDTTGRTAPTTSPKNADPSKFIAKFISGSGVPSRLGPQPAAGCDDGGDTRSHHRNQHADGSRQRCRKPHLAAPPTRPPTFAWVSGVWQPTAGQVQGKSCPCFAAFAGIPAAATATGPVATDGHERLDFPGRAENE
jgi:hypothetical protein